MDLVNKQVSHNIFGIGTIIIQEENMLTVCFQEHGDKRFHFPDAFERYLQLCDAEFHAAVIAEIRQQKADAAEENQRKQELYENYVQHQSREKARMTALAKETPARKNASKAKNKTISK